MKNRNSFFSSLTENISNFTSSTLTEATKAREKFFEGQTAAEQIAFTSLWELPEPVEFCRECQYQFQVPTQKHHCRSCGGVFCDPCCPSGLPSSYERNFLIPTALNLSPTEAVRLCLGCKRGECPSKNIKEKIRKQLDEGLGVKSGRMEKFGAKMTAKLTEAVTKLDRLTGSSDPNSPDYASSINRYLSIRRGSFYGENNMIKKCGTKPLPVSGYFELYNKSNEIIVIKVMKSYKDETISRANFMMNIKFESSRSSYIAIPPNDAVFAHFHSSTDYLNLFVLFSNPNPLPHDTAIVYDTKAHGSNPSKISLCARVDLFEKLNVFNLWTSVGGGVDGKDEGGGKNILLKYKGNGILLPREGTSPARIGIWNYFQGRRFQDGKIDYETNITTLSIDYSLH
jgi:hypothetical protein